MQKAMAARPAVLRQGDNVKLERVKKQVPFRALFGMRLGTNTYANTFTPANFNPNGSGVDLAESASEAADPGNSVYNNFIGKERKPLFRLEAEAIGVHISDPGDERIRAWLIENSKLEIKIGTSSVVKQPCVALPPGLGVVRNGIDVTSGAKRYFETHGVPSPAAAGVFRFPQDIVFPTDKAVEARLFVDETTRAALAALSGSTPAPGIFIAVVIYGTASASAGLLFG